MGSCYMFRANSSYWLPWAAARQQCRMLQGDLAVMNPSDIQNAVALTLRNLSINGRSYLLDSCKQRNGPGVMVVRFMILGFGGKDFQVFLRLNPVQQLLGVDLWTFHVVGGVSLSVDKVSI